MASDWNSGAGVTQKLQGWILTMKSLGEMTSIWQSIESTTPALQSLGAELLPQLRTILEPYDLMEFTLLGFDLLVTYHPFLLPYFSPLEWGYLYYASHHCIMEAQNSYGFTCSQLERNFASWGHTSSLTHIWFWNSECLGDNWNSMRAWSCDPNDGISDSHKRHRRACFLSLYHVQMQWEGGLLQARKPLPGNQIFTLDFSIYRTVRNKSIV